MVAVHPQYIVDENATQKAVIIQFDEWQKILERLEELDDIEAYDKAKTKKNEALPFEQAVREIKNGTVS
jgi:hypothetical protein